MTAATLTGFHIKFQCTVTLRQVDYGVLGLLAERRAAQISVDKYAGGICDGAQRRSIGREYVFCDAVGQLLFIGGRLSVVDGDAGRRRVRRVSRR